MTDQEMPHRWYTRIGLGGRLALLHLSLCVAWYFSFPLLRLLNWDHLARDAIGNIAIAAGWALGFPCLLPFLPCLARRFASQAEVVVFCVALVANSWANGYWWAGRVRAWRYRSGRGVQPEPPIDNPLSARLPRVLSDLVSVFFDPDPRNMSEQTEVTSILKLSTNELDEWCVVQGQPKYRAMQIRRRIFQNRVESFASMTDLPLTFRNRLESEFQLFECKVVQHQIATDRTEKLLLELTDGSTVECVLMRETDRRTICISTQVGCAMGCVFCASGMLGLKRNLNRAEILEQILRLDRLLEKDERLTNVVVMGIGEPLQNLNELLPVLDVVTEPSGLGLSPRRITVSTVGLPAKIRELAQTGKQFNLAVSLHAPNDRLRNELVPVNDKIGVAEILAAADDYFETTGRRVTYEYVLLGGLNDQPEHARELAGLLSRRNAHVNLIPMNEVETLPFQEPTTPRTREFVDILEDAGVAATVRKRKGADIDAACGQLRLKNDGLQQLSR